MIEDAKHCMRRIAAEEDAARRAGSAEAAEFHNQLAELYKIRLRVLTRQPQPASAY